MKPLLHILIGFILLGVYSCSKHGGSVIDENKKTFDLSQLYHMHSYASSLDEDIDEYIYDAHRKVPLGGMVTLSVLDSLFGEPFVCDTVKQTSSSRRLYEQECRVAYFLPTEVGDTLVMMRRLYGQQGDWIIWIDLEIQDADSLRVLNFLAYDNSQVDI